MVRSRRSIASVLVTLVVAAGVCAGAWAGPNTPNKQQYDNPAASEPTTVAQTTPSTAKPGKPTTQVAGALTPPRQPQTVQSATLPFSGQNIALVVLVGAVLVASGIGLRRARWHDR